MLDKLKDAKDRIAGGLGGLKEVSVAKLKDKKLLKPLLLALARTSEVRRSLHISDLTFAEVAVDAGLPPGVKLVFTR